MLLNIGVAEAGLECVDEEWLDVAVLVWEEVDADVSLYFYVHAHCYNSHLLVSTFSYHAIQSTLFVCH